MTRPAMFSRLIEADLVALGYVIAGAITGVFTVLFWLGGVPLALVLPHGALALLLMACGVLIEASARPGFFVSVDDGVEGERVG